MTAQLAFSQLLNGLQLGVLLFLLAGAYAGIRHHELRQPCARLALHAGRVLRCRNVCAHRVVLLGLIAAVVGAGLVGLLLDRFALTKLYERDHLDQVLATFGLILFSTN